MKSGGQGRQSRRGNSNPFLLTSIPQAQRTKGEMHYRQISSIRKPSLVENNKYKSRQHTRRHLCLCTPIMATSCWNDSTSSTVRKKKLVWFGLVKSSSVHSTIKKDVPRFHIWTGDLAWTAPFCGTMLYITGRGDVQKFYETAVHLKAPKPRALDKNYDL